MSKKHTHRYERINLGHNGKEYWVLKCNLPECSHYIAMRTKLSCPLLKGSVAVCNKCDEDFILNKRALRMAKPVCDDCVVKKSTTVEKIKSADDFFKDLESSVIKL